MTGCPYPGQMEQLSQALTPPFRPLLSAQHPLELPLPAKQYPQPDRRPFCVDEFPRPGPPSPTKTGWLVVISLFHPESHCFVLFQLFYLDISSNPRTNRVTIPPYVTDITSVNHPSSDRTKFSLPVLPKLLIPCIQ
jgi:hypothetical protein